MAQFDLSTAELRAYRPPRDEPRDFDAFWSESLSRSRAAPFEPVFMEVGTSLRTVSVFDVTKLELRPVLMGTIVDADDFATANIQAVAIDHDPLRWACNIIPPSLVNQVELLSDAGCVTRLPGSVLTSPTACQRIFRLSPCGPSLKW